MGTMKKLIEAVDRNEHEIALPNRDKTITKKFIGDVHHDDDADRVEEGNAQETCFACNGSGIDPYGERDETCITCGGKGYLDNGEYADDLDSNALTEELAAQFEDYVKNSAAPADEKTWVTITYKDGHTQTKAVTDKERKRYETASSVEKVEDAKGRKGRLDDAKLAEGNKTSFEIGKKKAVVEYKNDPPDERKMEELRKQQRNAKWEMHRKSDEENKKKEEEETVTEKVNRGNPYGGLRGHYAGARRGHGGANDPKLGYAPGANGKGPVDLKKALGSRWDEIQAEKAAMNAENPVKEAKGKSENRALWDKINSKGRLAPIDRERYTDLSHEGLEGPFRMKTGQVLYYDPKAGQYYNRDTDMYISNEEMDEINRYGLAESIDELDPAISPKTQFQRTKSSKSGSMPTAKLEKVAKMRAALEKLQGAVKAARAKIVTADKLDEAPIDQVVAAATPQGQGTSAPSAGATPTTATPATATSASKPASTSTAPVATAAPASTTAVAPATPADQAKSTATVVKAIADDPAVATKLSANPAAAKALGAVLGVKPK